MKTYIKFIAIFLGIVMLATNCNSKDDTKVKDSKITNVQIILGTTRNGRSSDKIAESLKADLSKRKDINVEIVDPKEFNLPFLNDEISPANRKGEITDPNIKKWSDKISCGDAYIIVVPEYNFGYPGVLKNALDLLYKEWAGKPVAFVGYSGGSTGRSKAIEQLKTVVKDGLHMKPIELDILIPQAWKAFDETRNLKNKNITSELNSVVDQLIKAKSTK